MTHQGSRGSTSRRGFASSAGLFGALFAVPFLLSASPAAAERERGTSSSERGAPVSAAPSAPSYSPAPARSAPAPSAPSASAPSRAPSRSDGGVVRSQPRGGREATSAPERVSGRGTGVVSVGPRGPVVDRRHRPHRRYYAPSIHWGTSWWWGGPWDWWWWGSGWGPSWGWGGVTVVQDFDRRSARYARVDTDVSPEAAEVYLDGTYIGSADDFDGLPEFLYLEPGKYRLEFRHPSYQTLVKELEVRHGQQVRLNDDLELLPGKGRMDAFDSPRRGTPLGRVFGKPDTDRDKPGRDRTGRFEGKSEPGSARDGKLEDLEDPDEVDEVDEVDDDADVEVEADEEVRETARPARPTPPSGARAQVGRATPDDDDSAPAARGRLRFEVEPDDAAVYLDDRYVGTGEELAGLGRGLSVKQGKHTVTVVRPGFGTKTVEVEAKPGTAIDVVIELEK